VLNEKQAAENHPVLAVEAAERGAKVRTVLSEKQAAENHPVQAIEAAERGVKVKTVVVVSIVLGVGTDLFRPS
jgi:hypothetical protein